MSNEWEWGVGNKADSKAFETGRFDDGQEFELIWGEHPHSRQDDRMYARLQNGTIEGFAGHRILTRVELRTFNYLKCSDLSGNQVRKGGQFKIYFNDILVWAEFIREADHGLRKAARRLEELADSPAHLWELEKLGGRKIFYMNCPAIIDSFHCDESEGAGNRIIIKADGCKIPMPAHYEHGERYDWDEDTVVTSTGDKNIWWFRD